MFCKAVTASAVVGFLLIAEAAWAQATKPTAKPAAPTKSTSAAPTAKPAPKFSPQEEAARQKILQSPEWREAQHAFHEWLSIQKTYSPADVKRMRAALEVLQVERQGHPDFGLVARWNGCEIEVRRQDSHDLIAQVIQRDVAVHNGGLGAETIAHYFGPNFTRRAVFGNLLEKIVVSVEKEAEARSEAVHR